jgi:hypothetical protein
MKKSILLLCSTFAAIGFSQNVTENKVTFNYIQLPTNPIDNQHSTFNVVVTRSYEQANEDSLNNYQVNLDAATTQYEGEMLAWNESKKSITRSYLTQLSTWEKNSNAGTVAPKPVQPPFPAQPVMRDVQLPFLHSDLNDEEVKNAMSLAGYDRGEGGATITVNVNPVSNVQIIEKKTGSATTTKYNYTANYKLPLDVTVETPSQGVILQTIVLNSIQSYKMKTYSSKYEHQLWMLDNREQLWIELERYARSRAFSQLSDIVNNKCGFPVKSITSEVYTIKKHKGHTYNDLVNAYTTASQGYQAIGQSRDRNNAKSKLTEAINIWKQALTESNVGDNKARINDKATAMLYCNIALAYIWMSEFDQAEQYINQAKNARVMKFKNIANRLQPLLTERRLRWNSNF